VVPKTLQCTVKGHACLASNNTGLQTAVFSQHKQEINMEE